MAIGTWWMMGAIVLLLLAIFWDDDKPLGRWHMRFWFCVIIANIWYAHGAGA